MVSHLQFVLIVDLLFIGPQLLGEVKGSGDVLRRHKVIDDLNTAMEVLNLAWRKRGSADYTTNKQNTS